MRAVWPEITILPDGRVYAFGIHREVLELLGSPGRPRPGHAATSCPGAAPDNRTYTTRLDPAERSVHAEPTRRPRDRSPAAVARCRRCCRPLPAAARRARGPDPRRYPIIYVVSWEEERSSCAARDCRRSGTRRFTSGRAVRASSSSGPTRSRARPARATPATRSPPSTPCSATSTPPSSCSRTFTVHRENRCNLTIIRRLRDVAHHPARHVQDGRPRLADDEDPAGTVQRRRRGRVRPPRRSTTSTACSTGSSTTSRTSRRSRSTSTPRAASSWSTPRAG